MKKILGISLFAMMAVTAANAEIASKAYVDQRETAINNTIGTSTAFSQGITATTVKGAINELYGLQSGNGEGSVSSQITTAIQGLDANDVVESGTSNNVVTAVAETDGKITVTKGDAVNAVAATTGAGNVITEISLNADGKTINSVKGISAQVTGNMITGTETSGANAIDQTATDKYPSMATAAAIAAAAVSNAGVGTQITDAIQALDANAVVNNGTSNNVVTAVAETDGKITVTTGDAVNTVAASSGAGNVITAISLNADGKTIDSVKGIRALQASDLTNSTTATSGQVVTAISMTNGVLSQTTADPLTNAAYTLQEAGVGAGKYALTAIVNGSGAVTGYAWELIERPAAGGGE